VARRRKPRRSKKKMIPTPQKEIPLVASTEALSSRDATQLPDDASQPDFVGLDKGTSSETPIDEFGKTYESQTTSAGLIQGLLTGRLKLNWTLLFQVLLILLIVGYFITVVLTFLQDNDTGEIITIEQFNLFLSKFGYISIFFGLPILVIAIILVIRSWRDNR